MSGDSTSEIERYYESYEKYGFDKTLQNNRELITMDDEQLIRDYIKYRHAVKGIQLARQVKIGAMLVYWRRYITKPYREISARDVVDGLSTFRTARSTKGELFKQNYQRDMIVTLKSFIRWLGREKIITVDLDELRDIKTPAINTDTDRAENLFTADEVKRMATACPKNMHKAFIYTIYEAGARPGEVAGLRWKDIAINKNSIQVTITDKKFKHERTAFIIAGKEYLLRHATDLPSLELDDYIFKDSRGRPLNPNSAYGVVNHAKNKAGIKKHLKLKLFRKSRVSNMMKEGYNDGAIREQIWGNQGTTMFKVYAKYSAQDIEKAMLIKAGIEVDDQAKEAQLKPRTCHVCGKVNEPDAKWCPACGTPLTEAVRRSSEDLDSTLENTPEYKDIIDRLLAIEAELAKK